MNRLFPLAALVLAGCASANAQSRPVADSASVATILESARGANALMCDGSCKFLKDSTGMQTIWALGSVAQGEIVSADAY